MIAVLDQFFDPLAVLIVIGGTIVGTVLSTTRGDLGRAFGALGPLLRADPVADGEAARRAVRRIERISEYKGIFCADRVKSPGAFVHRVACRLADASGAQRGSGKGKPQNGLGVDPEAKTCSSTSTWIGCRKNLKLIKIHRDLCNRCILNIQEQF